MKKIIIAMLIILLFASECSKKDVELYENNDLKCETKVTK